LYVSRARASIERARCVRVAHARRGAGLVVRAVVACAVLVACAVRAARAARVNAKRDVRARAARRVLAHGVLNLVPEAARLGERPEAVLVVARAARVGAVRQRVVVLESRVARVARVAVVSRRKIVRPRIVRRKVLRRRKKRRWRKLAHGGAELGVALAVVLRRRHGLGRCAR
jgi:hypothetical protein